MKQKVFTLFRSLLLSFTIFSNLLKAQTRVELRLVPDLWGYDYCLGQFVEGFKEKDYYFFQKRKLTNGFFSWGLGVEMELNHKWKTRLRYGDDVNGIGFIYNDLKKTTYPRLENGKRALGGKIVSVSINEKYKLVDKRFKKGLAKDFGIRLYGGLGLGFRYIPKPNISKEFVLDNRRAMFFVTSTYTKTKHRNTGMLNAGIDFQIRYRKAPVLELGFWYEYNLRPTEIYKYVMEHLSQPQYQDELQFYPGRHTWTVYIHIPMIKLYSNTKRLEKRAALLQQRQGS